MNRTSQRFLAASHAAAVTLAATAQPDSLRTDSVDLGFRTFQQRDLLSGTQAQQTNPFAAMYAAGHNKYTSRQMQFDAGIRLDLSRVLKGLAFKTHFAVDYATSYNTSINNDYSTYEASWNSTNGVDQITSLTKYGTDKSTGTQNISGSYDKQTMFFSAQFDYDRSFGPHNVAATLLANGFQHTYSGEYHRTSNANLGLQLNYNYQHTYYADLSMAAVHSSKLAPGHREALSPVLTLGWRMKNERWLRDVQWLDGLKLNASYGVIHQDLDISSYYMYDYVFTATGQWWGWSETAQSMQTSLSTRGEKRELGFVKRKEFRLGLETSILGGLVALEANYFRIHQDDQIVIPSIMYPSYFAAWNTSFLASTNYNNQTRNGIDSKDMVVLGKWQSPFTLGLNFTAKYRGFTLYLAGSGNFGGKGFKDNLLNWVYGDRKYTDVVLGRWTPETASTATYPRLNTLSGDLNFVASDYWLYSTSAFYLSRAQLTYDFPARLFAGSFVRGLQVYLYGADLLTLSGERRYLETAVGAAPQCRSYNLGAKISF